MTKCLRNTTRSTIFVVGLFLLSGCGISSPRFRTAEKEESAGTERKTTPRFSSKEAEEEAKENDKKVEPREVDRVLSGNRDFRKEKNPGIKPLDHSRIMREISKYMGVSYLHGGESPAGMDCSGYTMLVFKNSIGKVLPRTSFDQAKVGRPVKFEDLKFADLIFFNTTGQPGSHVGIYLGDDLFAHASVTLGVTISSLESSYYKRRYEGARRLIAE